MYLIIGVCNTKTAPVIGLIMCESVHKCLLHCVVDLCFGLEPMGLLLWLMSWPGGSGKYLNPPPTPVILTHLPPSHICNL